VRGAVVRTFNAAGGADAASDFHGTAIAGLIRAHGLIESAAPEARILAVRAFRTDRQNGSPETTSQILITAVNWAVTNGAKVLNMSFIGAHDAALLELLQAANQKGVVVVAAAGTAGLPRHPSTPPPIRCDCGHRGGRSGPPYEFANRDTQHAAPGVAILAPSSTAGMFPAHPSRRLRKRNCGTAFELDPTGPHMIADLTTGAEDLGQKGAMTIWRRRVNATAP
jgi:subtilisin family serine protease